MNARLLLLGIVALPMGFSPAPFPRARLPAQTDLERMQGTWELVELWINGRVYDEFRGHAVVSGRVWAMRLIDSGVPERPIEYRITLDTTATPRALDLRWPGKLPYWMKGIYRFPDSNTLVFCYRAGQGVDRVRPGAFMGEKKADVMVFRRVR